MSHLDDLDEYEAELELALKKEYQAVFALFRFCVLTQDATYLCNKLDVQQAAPSTAGGLPFFQLDLEDVGGAEDEFAPAALREKFDGQQLDVLFVGKFIPLHGVETIIRAAGTSFKRVIVGTCRLGPASTSLRRIGLRSARS